MHNSLIPDSFSLPLFWSIVMKNLIHSAGLLVAAALAAGFAGCTENAPLAPSIDNTLDRIVIAPGMMRPIEEFVHAQGTMIHNDDYLFAIDQGLFSWADHNKEITATVDYAGVLHRVALQSGMAVEVPLNPEGPKYWGRVQEQIMYDGTARVWVELYTEHAAAFAVKGIGPLGDAEIFGARKFWGPGGVPTARSTLRAAFRNEAPGAPLPDFVRMLREPRPNQRLEWISFHAEAESINPETGEMKTIVIDQPRYYTGVPLNAPMGTLPATIDLGGVLIAVSE
jgi:hypothetical protein